MFSMVDTTWSTTVRPSVATSVADRARSAAARAASAFWRTVAVICSIEAAVCCRF